MHMLLTYGFEIVLVLLLVATLYYAMRLESRLGVLKRDKVELERLVTGFNEATLRADGAIQKLRGAAEGAGRELASRQDAAEALRNDLQFLVDRGERVADRLDELVRSSRPLLAANEAGRSKSTGTAEARSARLATASADSARLMRAGDEPDEPRVRSQAERDLLRALRLAR